METQEVGLSYKKKNEINLARSHTAEEWGKLCMRASQGSTQLYFQTQETKQKTEFVVSLGYKVRL